MLTTNEKIIRDEGLLYEPAPVISKWFTEEFEKLVPLSPNGVDRLLRWVWGCDRTEFCGGYFERRYGDTDNDPARYVGRCRWILEGYQPPDIYNREEWDRQAHLLGPWPESGVWDFVAFHTDNQGGYLPLDQSALNHVQIWAHWQGKGRKASVEQLLGAKLELRKKRYKERKEASEKVSMAFGERVVQHFETARDVVSTVGKNPLKLPPGFSKTSSGLIIPTN